MRHTQIYIIYINKYIFLEAKILGGRLGPRIEGGAGAGGEDILGRGCREPAPSSTAAPFGKNLLC